MKPPNDLKRVWRELCADLDADDGKTQDELIKKNRRAQRSAKDQANNKTTLRLCSQVGKAIHLALAGDCGDERLQALEVLRVEPYPNASRLRVVLRPPDGTPASDYPALHAKLLAVQHLMTHAVATGTHRKRTPTLLFIIADHTDDGEADDE